jgi:hypothetical protein
MDFDMRDRDGGSSWRLGSEEGPVVSRHTSTSKEKFGKPKKI